MCRLYHSLSLVVIRCHSLSFVVTHYHSLSLVVPLLVTRCHSLSIVVPLVVTHCHSLSFVVTRCTTRLSFYKWSIWLEFLINRFLIKNVYFKNDDLQLHLYKSSQRRCSIKKGVLKNFAKFTGKRLCQSLSFNKVAGLGPATLFKKRLLHRCFL